MPRPILASLSIAALRHNLTVVRTVTRPERGSAPRVWAVVKAAAYGHGMQTAAAGFESADGMALLDFDDAVRLREAGWRGPVLMLEGAFERADVHVARAHALGLVVHRKDQIAWLRETQGAPIDVYLKMNTGMNRLGVPLARARQAHAELSAGDCGVTSLTLMTHFARADEPDGAAEQMERFDAATSDLPGARSLANSAAVFSCPRSHRDWVRPGIALYGSSPFADRSAASLGLRAAMTLASELIAVQSLQAGERVGYGGSFTAPGPMRIGIVACGYADGYPRHASTGTPVVVGGVRTRTVGRVSMDMLAVDLTALPHAVCGSTVELWGEQVSVDEVAQAAGTIGYELLCAVAPRVPRRIV